MRRPQARLSSDDTLRGILTLSHAHTPTHPYTHTLSRQPHLIRGHSRGQSHTKDRQTPILLRPPACPPHRVGIPRLPVSARRSRSLRRLSWLAKSRYTQVRVTRDETLPDTAAADSRTSNPKLTQVLIQILILIQAQAQVPASALSAGGRLRPGRIPWPASGTNDPQPRSRSTSLTTLLRSYSSPHP
jgi:hypothetical protein